MDIGVIGLGKMGAGMARRLLARGASGRGPRSCGSKRSRRWPGKGPREPRAWRRCCSGLPRPRLLLLMLPAGEPVEREVRRLRELLDGGDVLIDGGQQLLQRRPAACGLAGRARHPLPGRRRVRRGVGPRAGILPHGRGRAGGLRAGGAAPAGPGPGKRPAVRGPLRRGALPQNGAQRHRVRPHGSLRRGLRASGLLSLRARPGLRAGGRPLEPRQRDPLLAAGAAGARLRQGPPPGGDPRLRGGHRRGALDRRTGGGIRRRGHRHRPRPVQAFRFAQARHVRQPGARGSARRVRRPRSEARAEK